MIWASIGGNSSEMTRQDTAKEPAQIDLFADATSVPRATCISNMHVRHAASGPMEEADMVAHLAATGR